MIIHIHKTKKLLVILLMLFAGTLLINCEKIDLDNPWDAKADLNPNSWAPHNLEIELISITERKLTWQYGDHNIEGFKIDRKKGDGDWDNAFATLGKDARSWNDTEIVPDASLNYSYRVYAYAGSNVSDYDEAAYIPIELTTNEVTNISSTSATSGGVVIGSHVDSRGIAYGTSPDPDISGNTVQKGSGAGSFEANITGLNPSTNYYVRAYAKNIANTAYGENKVFTSLASLPIITTNIVTNITSFSATGGGNVTSDGGAPVTARGLAYGTSTNPTTSDNTASSGSGTGSFTVNMTELSPNTTYHVRAYATNTAGTAYGDNVLFNTLVHQCGTSITFMYKGQHVTYETIERGGLCWMDRNLGASRVPISNKDSHGFGDLFQWGRLDDGHQNWASSTTPGPINKDIPGHGSFITVNSSPMDWRSPQNHNLWQGEDGVNNPCPPAWRLPTEAELNAECQGWSSNNPAGAFASPLKWPLGGFRAGIGTISSMGSQAWVWSSSISGSSARFLLLTSFASIENGYRARGMSVRCVRDLETH